MNLLVIYMTLVIVICKVSIVSTANMPNQADINKLDVHDIPQDILENIRLHLGVYLRPLGQIIVSHKMIDSVIILPFATPKEISVKLPIPDICKVDPKERFINWINAEKHRFQQGLSYDTRESLRFQGLVGTQAQQYTTNIVENIAKYKNEICRKLQARLNETENRLFEKKQIIHYYGQEMNLLVGNFTYDMTDKYPTRKKRVALAAIAPIIGLGVKVGSAIYDYFKGRDMSKRVDRNTKIIDVLITQTSKQWGALSRLNNGLQKIMTQMNHTIAFIQNTLIRQYVHNLETDLRLTYLQILIQSSRIESEIDNSIIYLRNRLNSLILLQRGIVNADILLPQIIIDMLKYTESQVTQMFPDNIIQHDKPNYYYYMGIHAFAISEQNLILHFKVPVVNIMEAQYTLYRIESIPLALRTKDDEQAEYTTYTQVKCKAKVIGIQTNSKNAYHFELTTDEFARCTKYNGVYNCKVMLKMMHPSTHTCARAIFDNDLGLIAKLCESVVQIEFAEQLHALHLRSSFYLITVTKDKKWTIMCRRQLFPSEYTSSDLIIISLSCQCMLQTERVVILPQIDDCENGTNVQFHGATNIIAKYYFTKNYSLPDSDTIDLLVKPLDPISLKMQLSDNSKYNHKVEFPLAEVADNQQDDNILFLSEIDKLEYERSQVGFFRKHKKLSSIAILLSTMGVIALGIAIYVLIKGNYHFRLLAYLTTVGQIPQPVNGYSPNDVNWTQIALNRFQIFGLYVCAAICSYIFIQLICYLYRKCKIAKIYLSSEFGPKNGIATDIYLRIQNASSMKTLYIGTYSCCQPLKFMIKADMIETFRVVQAFSGSTLHIKWKTPLYSFLINDKGQVEPYMQISLPTIIKIPFFALPRVYAIIRGSKPVSQIIIVQDGLGLIIGPIDPDMHILKTDNDMDDQVQCSSN